MAYNCFLSKYFSQLFGEFLRQVEDQLRLQHLLQEVIVIPVIGIEILPVNDLEYHHGPSCSLCRME
jgi:hypothetical protein